MNRLLILCIVQSACLIRAVHGQTSPTAHVDQPIASPIFVNLYWDTSWDTDNPGMKTVQIDGLTQAIVDSSYFRGLAEYGVVSASFAGGFLPDPNCPSKAPSTVGFYDPVNTSIAGFVQCEHDHGPAILRQNSVIYNVILPPGSMESDFWSSNFCNGPGSPVAWHYHGLEDSFPNIFGGQPIYTIVQSNPKCGGNTTLLESLTHEMVEATTDPFPIDISIIPPHINIQTENEIADLCEGNDVNIFTDRTGQTSLATAVGVASFWSNALQKCVSFMDTTTPSVTNVAVSNWGSQTQVSVMGSGFGAMPAQVLLPTTGLPYLEISDHAHGWAAGDAINGDVDQLSLSAWSDAQISNAALVLPDGITVNNVPSAPLLAWICNPNSLKCASQTATAAPGPFNPRLQLFLIVGGSFVGAADTFSVFLNGKSILTDTVSANCNSACVFSSLQTLVPGAYAATPQVSGATPVKSVGNTCGQVSLALGEETSCRISYSTASNPTGGCSVGYKCCEPGTTKCAMCRPQKTSCP